MNTVLFLCTGNYYRSRFAEEYFNHHAAQRGLDWKAESKGIQRSFEGNGNVGPMSVHTIEALAALAITPAGAERMPLRVETDDFNAYSRVIAVSKDEHEPMLAEHWPASVTASVAFFDVEDLHIEGSNTAIPRLQSHLDTLLASL